MQISRDGEIGPADYDYGADKAYWIGDNLVLRYTDELILFDASSTKDLLDSEICAAFLREKYEKTNNMTNAWLMLAFE